MKSQRLCIFLTALLLSMVMIRCAVCQITITNHDSDSTVRYPVILLRGTVAESIENLAIENKNPRKFSGKVRPIIHQGRFKALVELSQGENTIELIGDDQSKSSIRINYQPQTNPYYVRVIWMTDVDGDTKFAAPNDQVPQDYEARLRTAAELMQTFTAERMHELGFGRLTFRLERDGDGQVIVNTFAGDQKAEHYYGLNDQVWWRDVWRWVNQKHSDPFAKNMVLAAYTRKDPESNRFKAHTALGGGNLGLFGSASVFCWPRSIESASESFMDATVVRSPQVNDDSNGRRTYWGVASTTIGATLHEMGHTFDLLHCSDSKGIMSRGFDYFNRTFTFADPPSGRNEKPIFLTEKDEARFSPISASMLQWCKWFHLDDKQLTGNQRPRIRYNKNSREFTVSSKAGIPWIGMTTGSSDMGGYRIYDTTPIPEQVKLTLDEIKELLGEKELKSIIAIDTHGQVSRYPFRN